MPIIAYIPTYSELDSVIEKFPKAKTVNVFLDLKNSMVLLYSKNFVSSMMEVTSNTDKPNAQILLSWLDFISFHYRYALDRKIDLNIFTYADSGEYMYHKSIYKEYKSNRSVTKMKTSSYLVNDDDFNKIKLKNIESIMKMGKRLYNTHSTYLTFCESDFVPEYYISKRFNSEYYLNLLYSSDRDMIQTVRFDNTVQFMKTTNKVRRFIDKNNWTSVFDIEESMNIENYLYMKAIMGDKGDGIPGISGLGEKKAFKIVKSLENIENFDDFKKKIEEKSNLDDNLGKMCKKVLENMPDVYRNYRLMSFDELIKHLSIDSYKKLEEDQNSGKLSFLETKECIESLERRLID